MEVNFMLGSNRGASIPVQEIFAGRSAKDLLIIKLKYSLCYTVNKSINSNSGGDTENTSR